MKFEAELLFCLCRGTFAQWVLAFEGVAIAESGVFPPEAIMHPCPLVVFRFLRGHERSICGCHNQDVLQLRRLAPADVRLERSLA